MNKKGAAMGEWVVMMYRFILVMLIALVILGSSSIFYAHEINIRNTEARLVGRQVVDCLTKDLGLEIKKIEEIKSKGLFEYCNLGGADNDRFFVRVIFEEINGKEIVRIEQGDSGALWIRKIFEKAESGEGEIRKYIPGYFENGPPYPVIFDGSRKYLKIEVLVKNE